MDDSTPLFGWSGSFFGVENGFPLVSLSFFVMPFYTWFLPSPLTCLTRLLFPIKFHLGNLLVVPVGSTLILFTYFPIILLLFFSLQLP